jgi:predicted DCC family thiol-disulfide oxidoreductase YuxK
MAPTFSPAQSEATVLYDGDCGFCGSAVRLIRANDPAGRFRYVTLGSDEGRTLVAAGGGDPDAEPSLILVDRQGLHAASDAVVRIGRELRAPWPLLAAVLGVVPRPLREAVYRRVARQRYCLSR